jgi:hypothetical protein
LLQRLGSGLVIAIVRILRLRKQWHCHAYFELVGIVSGTKIGYQAVGLSIYIKRIAAIIPQKVRLALIWSASKIRYQEFS